MTFRTVDIFSGCGGLSLGFQQAGFDILAAYDNWDLACSVQKANFHHDVHLFDLTDVQRASAHISQYNPDFLIGGPPCQDFSIAGKRREADKASLTVAFAEIAAKVRPKVVVMENVYNIEKSKSLQTALRILRGHGYGITRRVIDASRVGVPQKRRRFFLIAALHQPDEIFGTHLDSNLASKHMTVHEYFEGELDTEYYYAHPRSYNRRAVFSVYEPSSTVRRVNRPVPPNYSRHPADKAEVSEAVRPLTTLERARIQTFPKDFRFLGTVSQKEHLIANAVPVQLAEYVANQILKTPIMLGNEILVKGAS